MEEQTHALDNVFINASCNCDGPSICYGCRVLYALRAAGTADSFTCAKAGLFFF